MIDDENWEDKHDDLTFEERYGDSHTGVNNDGFRPRKTRPDGWLEAAIADGSVADPEQGGEAHQDYSGRSNIHVVEAPIATIEGDDASEEQE